MTQLDPQIRLATETDAEAMLEIYASVVRETAISFELEPPSAAEFRARVRSTLAQTPWLVCEIDGQVAVGVATRGRCAKDAGATAAFAGYACV